MPRISTYLKQSDEKFKDTWLFRGWVIQKWTKRVGLVRKWINEYNQHGKKTSSSTITSTKLDDCVLGSNLDLIQMSFMYYRPYMKEFGIY